MAIELFNSRAQFVMPSAEAVASLSPEQQQRFESVAKAARAREDAVAATTRARQRVADTVTELRAAEDNLRKLRPPLDPVTAARQFIASNKR